jgi:hypothetical protein
VWACGRVGVLEVGGGELKAVWGVGCGVWGEVWGVGVSGYRGVGVRRWAALRNSKKDEKTHRFK